MGKLDRYSRQILFSPIGEDGQKKLINSRVVIVGMGALGTVIANHLVRAGIGHVRMIDRDLVEMSNLQRQSLYDEEDAANLLPKVMAAKERLQQINSDVHIDAIVADVTVDNADELLSNTDIILDGTDNFMTRYLMNDVAVKYGIPWIYGGAVSSRGMFAVIIPGVTPCYRCMFPDIPVGLGETCDTIGVLSPITDIVGSYQAVEAIKLLVGAQHNPNLEQMDIWNNSFMQMDLSLGHNPDCPACVHKQFEFLERPLNSRMKVTTLCGRDTIQINPHSKHGMDLENLAARLQVVGKVEGNAFVMRFTPIQGIKMVFFRDGRVLIHGIDDPNQAKELYAKYAGL